MNNCESNILTTVIQIVSIIGTLIIAILAIWGNWFRYKLAPPILKIEKHNLRGSLTTFTGGKKVIYYHLKVINKRNWVIAKNCRIILREMYKKLPNGDFKRLTLNVYPQLVWSNPTITPLFVDLTNEQVFDFGNLSEDSDNFKPVLYLYANDFEGFLKKDESIRYALEIVADGFKMKKYQIFEVSWNGLWSDNLDVMEKNIVIKEIQN